jgi:hypothetical protein
VPYVLCFNVHILIAAYLSLELWNEPVGSKCPAGRIPLFAAI